MEETSLWVLTSCALGSSLLALSISISPSSRFPGFFVSVSFNPKTSGFYCLQAGDFRTECEGYCWPDSAHSVSLLLSTSTGENSDSNNRCFDLPGNARLTAKPGAGAHLVYACGLTLAITSESTVPWHDEARTTLWQWFMDLTHESSTRLSMSSQGSTYVMPSFVLDNLVMPATGESRSRRVNVGCLCAATKRESRSSRPMANFDEELISLTLMVDRLLSLRLRSSQCPRSRDTMRHGAASCWGSEESRSQLCDTRPARGELFSQFHG